MDKRVKLSCNFSKEDYLVIYENSVGNYTVDFHSNEDHLIVNKQDLEKLIENLEAMIKWTTLQGQKKRL